MKDTVVHHGQCHCGAVTFEVDAPASIEALDCNCSMCHKLGYQHLIVDKAQFRLLSGEEELSVYQFNTGIAKHTFCKICGIKSFYTPRSHPDRISVNVRCLDPDSIESLRLTPFNGKNWQASYAKLKNTD